MNIGPVTPEHDLWNQYLRMLVPHDRIISTLQNVQVPPPVAPWAPVLEAILVAFSSVIIVLAILWLIWQTISSVVNAAWSGEAVAREWHSIWGPLRIAMGLGLIAPVANGNNIAQIGVIQVSLWSGQAANTIYQAMMGVLDVQNTNARLVLEPEEISRLVRMMSLIDLCSRSVRHFDGQNIPRGGNPGQAAAMRNGAQAVLTPDEPVAVAQRDSNGISFGGHVACPGLRLDYADPSRDMLTRAFDMFRGNAQVEMRRRVREIWTNAMNEIADDFRPVGADLMRGTFGATSSNGQNGGASDMVARYREWETRAMARWERASEEVVAVVREATSRRGDGVSAASLGWLGAPALIFQRTTMMREAWAAANARPVLVRGREFEAALNNAAQQPRYRRYDQMLAVLGDEVSSSLPAAQRAALANQTSQQTLALNQTTRTAVGFGLIPDVNIRSGSPLMQVADWGFWLMQTGSVVWGVSVAGQMTATAAATAGGAARAVGFVSQGTLVEMLSRAIGAIASFGAFIGGVMILIGALHAYVLPLMPTIIFIIFALGCLVLVVEALIAAPLWALGHVKLAGQGMVDHTQLPGYQILLNLFVRIPIAMMAFAFSLLTADVSLFGVSQLLGLGFGNMSPFSGDIGPFGYVTFMLVYGFVSWTICLRSFSMINELPDKVLRWIQIQSAANPDDGQRYVVGGVAMGMQRAGMATGAAAGALVGPVRTAGAAASQAARALPAPGPASRIPRRPRV